MLKPGFPMSLLQNRPGSGSWIRSGRRIPDESDFTFSNRRDQTVFAPIYQASGGKTASIHAACAAGTLQRAFPLPNSLSRLCAAQIRFHSVEIAAFPRCKNGRGEVTGGQRQHDVRPKAGAQQRRRPRMRLEFEVSGHWLTMRIAPGPCQAVGQGETQSRHLPRCLSRLRG